MREAEIRNDDNLISKVVAVYKNIKGISFISSPIGFGWAPERHYRARIAYNTEEHDVILKRCWGNEAYKTERYVYETILPSMPFKTAAFYGAIELEGEYWILMEVIGQECAEGQNQHDRKEFLKILGQLHGKNLSAIEQVCQNIQLQRFIDNQEEYSDKAELLLKANQNETLRADKWIINLHEIVWKELVSDAQTIIHGDTDFSNVIKNKKGFGLIDFERCKVGPISLDLSKIAQYIVCDEEYRTYQDAFIQESKISIPIEKVLRWARLGKAYDGLHWICYDIRNFFYPSYEGYIFDNASYKEKISKLKSLYIEYFLRKV